MELVAILAPVLAGIVSQRNIGDACSGLPFVVEIFLDVELEGVGALSRQRLVFLNGRIGVTIGLVFLVGGTDGDVDGIIADSGGDLTAGFLGGLKNPSKDEGELRTLSDAPPPVGIGVVDRGAFQSVGNEFKAEGLDVDGLAGLRAVRTLAVLANFVWMAILSTLVLSMVTTCVPPCLPKVSLSGWTAM